MKDKYIELYMDLAERIAQTSYAVRTKAGAIIVKDDIIVYGYNGTPSGWDNVCEYREYMSSDAGGWLSPDEMQLRRPYEINVFGEPYQRYALVTKPEVLHAEMNAISKIAKSTISSEGATMFVTCSPCMECAKAIYQAGITTVYYRDKYRLLHGLEFLEKSNIRTIQVKKGE